MAGWLAGDVERAADTGRDLLAWSQGAASTRRMGVCFAAAGAVETGRVDEATAWIATMDAVYGGRPFWFQADLVPWVERRPGRIRR